MLCFSLRNTVSEMTDQQKKPLLPLTTAEAPHATTAAPNTTSSILPWAMRCVCCLSVFVLALWLTGFVLTCLLLHWADTPEVHRACAGFWDFMLVSILSPVLVPAAYLSLVCVIGGFLPWDYFSCGCMLIMGISSLFMTLTAASRGECVEALRHPSVPWLIYIGWLKAAAYCAGALSTLCGSSISHPPQHA